jgi:hypothetical protein
MLDGRWMILLFKMLFSVSAIARRIYVGLEETKGLEGLAGRFRTFLNLGANQSDNY